MHDLLKANWFTTVNCRVTRNVLFAPSNEVRDLPARIAMSIVVNHRPQITTEYISFANAEFSYWRSTETLGWNLVL